MPLYSYSRRLEGDSYVVVRQFPVDQIPETIQDESGETLYRDVVADMRTQGRPSTTGYPIHCRGSAVHPSQAQELRDYLHHHGVPTNVDGQGRPIYRDASHRRKALKARGLYDRDGY